MKRWHKSFAVLFVCLLSFGSIGYLGLQHFGKAAYADGTFTPIDLGVNFIPAGISSSGMVAGTILGTYGPNRAVIWKSGNITNLSLPSGFTGASSANGMSPSGETVGYVGVATVKWDTSGSMTLMDDAQSDADCNYNYNGAFAVNSNGDIAGFCGPNGGTYYAGYWPQGKPNSFTKISDTTNSEVTGINTIGHMVGTSVVYDITTSQDTIHPFYWHDGTETDLAPSGSVYDVANAINDNDLIVGTVNYADSDGNLTEHPYVWDRAGNHTYDLYNLTGFKGAASAVNDFGVVTGGISVPNDSNTHAFMWQQGSSSIVDLNNLLPANSGWVLVSADKINDRGQIVGTGIYNGNVHGYLLNPSTPSSYRLSLAPASQTATIGGGQGLMKATLLDGATGAPASNVKLSFRVEAGPNAGLSGTCFPSSCTTDANGQVDWGYLGKAIGVDTVQVWVDTNGNGVPDTGEPQATASMQWTTSATCQDAAFIAAIGSGQHYKSDTDLSISPQLLSVYNAMMSRLAGRKSVLVRVLDYPALSVDVLRRNLNTGNLSTRWHQFFGVNLPTYLAGKDKGVAALWGAVTQVRFSCPNQKIVLAGYSQGAMVVHEFLEELATGNDTATKSAIRGVVLVADPERVRHSHVLEFGSAAWNEYGICNFPGLSRFTSCSGPLQLTDVPAKFLPVATDVCFQYDIVCDTGELLHDFNVNTLKGYREAINLGIFIHTGLYQGSPKTKTAGYRAANLLLARG